MKLRAPYVAALFAGLALAAWGSVRLLEQDTPRSARATETLAPPTAAGAPASNAPGGTSSTDRAAIVTRAASAPPSATATSSNAASSALASADPAVRRVAIEAALARKDVDALPAIEGVELAADAEVAAAAIDAVGKLAASASPDARRRAVGTLARWLHDESRREGVDARGNVSILIDALADTGAADASAPLIAALDTGVYPLHLETRIVQSLAALRAREATASIERFAARLASRTAADDFERALIAEGGEAARTALATLRG